MNFNFLQWLMSVVIVSFVSCRIGDLGITAAGKEFWLLVIGGGLLVGASYAALETRKKQ